MRYNTEGKNFFIAHEPFREFSHFHCGQMKITPDDNCWKGSSFPGKRSNANQYNTFLSQREVGSILLCSLVFLIPFFFFLNLVISVYFSEFTLFINGPSHDFPCRGFWWHHYLFHFRLVSVLGHRAFRRKPGIHFSSESMPRKRFLTRLLSHCCADLVGSGLLLSNKMRISSMTYDIYTHYRFMIANARVLGFSDAPIRQDGASPVFRQEYCERKIGISC